MYKIWLFLRHWLLSLRAAPEETSQPTSGVGHNKPPSEKRDGAEIEETGTFYYLGDVLERLSEYFTYIKYLKYNDVEAYDLYSQVGGQITTSSVLMRSDAPEPLVKDPKKMPAFFLLSILGGEDLTDTITCKLIYFRKIARWSGAEISRGTIFEGTFYYTEKNSPRNKRIPAVFHISIDDDGKIRLLKDATIRQQHVGKRRSATTVFHKEFKYPVFFDAIIDWQKEKGIEVETAQDIAKKMFYIALNTSINSLGGFRVVVKKGVLRAVIGVDMLRTPYFFKDRDIVVNENGRKKKIFHIVRTHVRKTGAAVRSHFRGSRDFVWNGYRVVISMPGKHHTPVNEFTEGTVEEGMVDKDEKLMPVKEAAGLIAKMVETSK